MLGAVRPIDRFLGNIILANSKITAINHLPAAQ